MMNRSRRRANPEAYSVECLSACELRKLGPGTREAINKWRIKFAINAVLDQTIGYFDGEYFTTKHPEAVLFDSLEAAEAELRAKDYVEFVFDEAEFRAREDTW